MPDDPKLALAVADGGRLRATLLELWQRTRMDWGFVTDRLAITFRKERWIGGHERRFISETLYGMVRNLRRIDLAIERARPTKQAPKDLDRLLVLLVLEGQLDPQRLPEGLDRAAVLGVDQVIAAERKPARRIALGASFPDWLAEMFVADHGDRAEALARSLNERAPMTVRANTLITTRDELATALKAEKLETHAGAHSDTALIIDSRTNLFATKAFEAGAFEAQDEGSQLLAELATPSSAKPLVIDYCAGAGGKTLAIAARLANRGRIIATDIDDKKLEELRRRARRGKVSNARALRVDDRELDQLHAKADMVFVDAPCTGTGALRRNPESRWRLRESEIAGFAKRQLEIVNTARGLLAPGGLLVYATCSVLAAENQRVAEQVPLTPVPLEELWPADRAERLGDGEALALTPDRHGTDGFYARVFRS
ncbi:MAG: methyltransferase domain-containing protein [Kofleriaceae bacterium]